MSKVIIKDKQFDTELALTAEECQNGLMHRKDPSIMSFVFPEAGVHKFWMKNTPAALDIIFCKNGSIVSIEKGIPFNIDLVGPNSIVDMVVEMPYGSCEKNGIKVGDPIRLAMKMDDYAKMFMVFAAG